MGKKMTASGDLQSKEDIKELIDLVITDQLLLQVKAGREKYGIKDNSVESLLSLCKAKDIPMKVTIEYKNNVLPAIITDSANDLPFD